METLPFMSELTLYCGWARRVAVVRCLSYDGRTPVGILSCSVFDGEMGLPCGTPCVGWAPRDADPACRSTSETALAGVAEGAK